MIQLSAENQRFIGGAGHSVVIGGPGCGKTTMALLKAHQEVTKKGLKPGQRLLFLSFARATIARVEQHAKTILDAESRSDLEINTYHGFTWALLRSHGYLLVRKGLKLKLLPPPQAASLLASIEGNDAKEAEKQRLFIENGQVHFDLFASLAADLFRRSPKLRNIVCQRYPIIILDEFQDTNGDEWALIKELGKGSTLIALADPEQRIYEFRGASANRIAEYEEQFKPTLYDFSGDRHRSAGTDICDYGNDLLTGRNRGKKYKNVTLHPYPIRKKDGRHLHLKVRVIQRIQHLHALGKPWSLAVLVPTKSLMLDVSDYLSSSQTFSGNKKIPKVNHEVALETAGPALAATVIGGLLEGGASPADIAQRLITDLCDHIKGRKGTDTPSKAQLELAFSLADYLSSGNLRGKKRKALAAECLAIGKARFELSLSGDPEKDWLRVRALLGGASSADLRTIAEDALYLKFLHKGAQLRTRLSEIWRGSRGYIGARQAILDALLQEHFATSTKDFSGVHVMTMHKSKGKEFDEVICYEGTFQGRYVRADADEGRRRQALFSLRVGVTRSKAHTSIFTPAADPCPFLV